jgi:hypothetical protein
LIGMTFGAEKLCFVFEADGVFDAVASHRCTRGQTALQLLKLAGVQISGSHRNSGTIHSARGRNANQTAGRALLIAWRALPNRRGIWLRFRVHSADPAQPRLRRLVRRIVRQCDSLGTASESSARDKHARGSDMLS